MLFITTISDIPCKCAVDISSPDFEYKILDMNNQPMPWMKAHIDRATELRLLEEYKFEEMAQYWGH